MVQLNILTERERYVVERYYGLNGKAELTLDEIGTDLELTRERVRQIREKAMRRLKSKGSFRDDMRSLLENMA